MVLQTERYPGGYHQNNYSAYQGPNGSYTNFQDVTKQTTPYSGYHQGTTYGLQHQSGWPTDGGYQGNGGSHYPGSGTGASLKPTYNNQHNYGSVHGQGHGGPYNHGHGGSHGLNNGHGSHGGHVGPQSHDHGYGNSHGYGGGAPNHFDKPTHNGYGNGMPNYGHSPSGMNHGYNQKPTWDLKGLDDDDE